MKRSTINLTRRQQLRMRLRRGGAVLVPFDEAELLSAALRNQVAHSPEFNAIMQSIDLVRLAEVPVFPADVPWFALGLTAVKNAIHNLWADQKNLPRAGELSDQLLALHMAPEDWEFAWRGATPADWVFTVSGALYAGLSLPVAVRDPASKEAFDSWLERTVLQPMRDLQPDQYEWLIRYLINIMDRGSKPRK